MPIAFQLLLVIATKGTKREQNSSVHEPARENQFEQTQDTSDKTQGDVAAQVPLGESIPHETSVNCKNGLGLEEDSADSQVSGVDQADQIPSPEARTQSPTVPAEVVELDKLVTLATDEGSIFSDESEVIAGSSEVMSEDSETVMLSTSESGTSGQDASQEIIKTPLGLGVIDEAYNFICEFNSSKIQNAEQALVNSQDSVGGVVKPAIFEQPGVRGDARIEYELSLPKVVGDEQLVFHFSTGLRDGIDFDYPLTKPDGVRFSIEISGKLRFEGVSLTCEWEEHVIDVTELTGQDIKVAFLTACNGRSSADYNWALWGNPRILKLVHKSLPVEKGVPEARIVRGLAVGRFDSTKIVKGREHLENRMDGVSSVELSVLEFSYSSPTPVSQIANEMSQRLFADAETRGYSTERSSEKFELALYTELPSIELLSLGLTTAMTTVGEDFEVQCKIRNKGLGSLTSVNQASVAISRIKLRRGRHTYPIKALDSGEETKLVWHVRKFSRESVAQISVSLKYRTAIGDVRRTLEKAIDIRPAEPKDTAQIISELHTYNLQEHLVLGNKNLRLLFVQGTRGFEYYRVFAAKQGNYRQVATCHTISEVHYLDLKGDRQRIRILPTTYRLVGNSRGESILILGSEQEGPDGVRWVFEARFSLTENDKCVSTEYSLASDRQCQLLAFNGPMLYAGDRCYGESKTAAIFPGLEFLESNELSSSSQYVAPAYNNRLVPHPSQITVPLMVVEHRKSVVGLAWNPLETWDGERNLLSAIFASPNWHEDQQNHLMGLFVPALQKWVEEDSVQASIPYDLGADRKLTIKAQIIVDGDISAVDAISHWANAYGTLEAPRSDEEELILSRHGFMKMAWGKPSDKSQHRVEWPTGNVPEIATLLWYDYLATQDESVKQHALAIVESALRESGPAGLISAETCQILKWELPFYFGHVEVGLECLKETIQSLIRSQEEDGSWCFRPITENSKKNGQDGDTVLGTCAHSALMLFRHARITGDEESLNAGVKALTVMDRFKVPRGAQPSVSHLKTPDLLAAAHGVGAYVEAYRVTAEKHYLERAEYWAKTGLAFFYHWHLPDRPSMRFASVPVFGMMPSPRARFGVPAQRIGLVFGYYLQQLARHRQNNDWKSIAEGITISGMYQQWTEGEFTGTYPDGLYEFCTERRAPNLTPENIMVNLYTLRGRDPDVSTAVLRNESGRIHLSSGAKIQSSENSNDGGLVFRLNYPENETSYTIIAGFGSYPSGVKVHDRDFLVVGDLDRASSGWLYREEKDLIFVKYKHANRETDFQILSSLESITQGTKDVQEGKNQDDNILVVAQPEDSVERTISQADATNEVSHIDVPTKSVKQDNVKDETATVDAQNSANNEAMADTLPPPERDD